MKKCKKCGNRFFTHVMISDYCTTCLKEIPELKQQQKEIDQLKMNEQLNKIGKLQFPQLYEEKETVVLNAEGDGVMQMAIKIANNLGYEIVNTSSSMSMWTPLTKYTLIFKKEKRLRA